MGFELTDLAATVTSWGKGKPYLIPIRITEIEAEI
jgi:hypothetical protein